MNRENNQRFRGHLEPLESRFCLAAVSFGWDGPGKGGANLNYYIGQAPDYLDQAEVVAALKSALETWAAVIDVEFSAVPRPNLRDSIDLEFRSIDGPGGTLAQAYLPDDVNWPRIAGDVTFDTAETWELGNSQGGAAFDLVLIAVHEIGHALGLEHSNAAGSVMMASASPYQSFRGLGTADVDAALAQYAPAVEELSVLGDYDSDGWVDSADVDLFLDALRSSDPDVRFDLTGDGSVDTSDRDKLIEEVLGTTYGDANLDGSFDSFDIVQSLSTNAYLSLSDNVTWQQGDWNGDGIFDSQDLVLALQSGGYVG